MPVSGRLHDPAVLSLRRETISYIEYEANWAPESVWTLRRIVEYMAFVGK
jgi:hypothetical protein